MPGSITHTKTHVVAHCHSSLLASAARLSAGEVRTLLGPTFFKRGNFGAGVEVGRGTVETALFKRLIPT